VENIKRRNRYRPLRARQATHQAYLSYCQIFDLHVMSELEQEEKKQEVPGHQLTHIDWIKRVAKHLIKYALNHTSYYAAVTICRILGAYSAEQLGYLYQIVAPNRADSKGEPECSKAKSKLRRSAASRFGITQEDLFNEEESKTLPRDDWRVSLTIQSLDCFVPSNKALVIPTSYREGMELLTYNKEDPHGDAEIEVKRMCLFFKIMNFNRIASALNLRSFEESVKNLRNHWPFPRDPVRGTPSNGDNSPQYDLKAIRDLVARERVRRRRVAPGSLTIRVDGIDRATISDSESEHAMSLEPDATMFDVVGQDDEGPVVLATYLLTYDEPKTEVWTVDLPWSEQVLCTFEYDEDDSVRAEFKLARSMPLGSRSPNGIGRRDNIIANALSPGWLKARIVLDFAGKALIAIGLVLATLLYANRQQILNNQRAANELNLGYFQRFSQDIGSDDPSRRSQAIAIYRVMSPQLAAQLAPIAAGVDPLTATSRSVEILGDRSQTAQTRSLAEQSRRQIMSNFRITEPSYGANVEVRKIIRGTTPFRGTRHYIIVTTPQGVDYVVSEARVTGDLWEGVATFGAAGAGGEEIFHVRVIATKATLSEGPFDGTADAISSDSISVVRRP
jgi:hypothetical protein